MVVLFDGVCRFCHGWVEWLIRRDSEERFYFASLQSQVAQKIVQAHGSKPDVDSILLVEGERVYSESTAILRICRGLGGTWKLLYGLIVIPRPIRDEMYRWVARNRYRWFGKQRECMIPSAEMRSRFLDQP